MSYYCENKCSNLMCEFVMFHRKWQPVCYLVDCALVIHIINMFVTQWYRYSLPFIDVTILWIDKAVDCYFGECGR